MQSRLQASAVSSLSLNRFLDSFPAMLALAALIGGLMGAVMMPEFMLMLGAGVAVYSALRFIIASLAYLYGLRRIGQDVRTDWYARYLVDCTDQSLVWEQVRHIVIIPNYAESLHTLNASLANLARVEFAAEQMVVVLAMEAREPGALRKAKHLQKQFAGCFAQIYITLHPDHLPGEIRCKSANQAWAARWVKRELVERQGWDLSHIVVTTMDADTIWHPAYFDALTYFYAVDPSRYYRIWQAPLRYHSNVYRISPLMRVTNAYATAFELAYLAAPHWLTLPMSSYSLSLKLLEHCGYWDSDVIADEWHTYIKIYFATQGRLRITPIFLPFLATAVSGNTLWDSIKNRYRQSLRHAWGTKEISYTVLQMGRPTGTPIWRGMRLLVRVAHDILHAGAGWVFLTAATQLPVLFNPHLLDRGVLYPPFLLLNVAFLVMFWLGVVFWWLDIDTRPSAKQRVSRGEWLTMLASPILLPLIALVFVSLPVLHAQFRLMLGHDLVFHVTAKHH